MKKRILALFMLFLLGLNTVGSIPAQAAAIPVYVISNTLNVYKKAATSSKRLGVMSYGQGLYCLAVSGKWAKVKNSSGSVGYCAKSGLSKKNPNTLSKDVYISANNTRVYRYPSAKSKVLGKLACNAKLKAVAVTADGKWVRVKGGSRYGYVAKSALSTSKKGVSKGQKIADLAAKQLGKGYSYGAEGGGKFDCSGLCYYVYKNAAGVSLKRTSDQQASDGRFKKISAMSELKQGDLLCFNTGGNGVDHVGIYIGGGKFVHASASKGQVVSSKLNTGYYRSSFCWARRIV